VIGNGPSTSASRRSGVSDPHTIIVTSPATAMTKSMWNACDCSSARSRISGSPCRIEVARMCAQ
jgi:hypothetical protein